VLIVGLEYKVQVCAGVL